MGIMLADERRVLVPVRQRQVRTLGTVLPALGVSITPSEDGHVSVHLPAEVAELFLLDLEQRAKEWQEAMRKARLQEQTRQAELRAHSEETCRHVEAQEDRWTVEYERLRAGGKGRREALWIVRGPEEEGAVSVTMLEMGIAASRARRKAQARATRDAAIARLAEEGLTRREIADKLGLEYSTVNVIVRRQGIPVRVKCRSPHKVPEAWCKWAKREGGHRGQHQ